MVEVFRTNVSKVRQARELESLLSLHFPGSRINFDLEDCDRVLRVEGENVSSGGITDLLRQRDFVCEVLE